MRIFILVVLLLTACSKEAPPAPSGGLAPGIFAAGERDALCVMGIGKVQTAGFISHGAGNENCSASGRIVEAKGQWFLQPAGDADCRIPLRVTKEGIALGAGAAACAYYCAPGLDFAGKSFTRIAQTKARPADIAGDALC